MIIKILLLLVLTGLILIKSTKNLHMLQQNLYNENNRYLKWLAKREKNVITLELLALVLLFLGNCLFSSEKGISFTFNLIAFFFYFLFALKYNNESSKEQVKKPLVYTARIKRLITTTFLVYLIPIFFFFLLKENSVKSLCVFFYALMTYLNALVFLITNFINKYTLEKYVYYHFKRKAIKKLNQMNQLKVIGITGSYGKTSSKNILADILNIKYITLPTPKNLNTPYGLIMTINNDLDKFNDVFIAEMGAYKPGEIKQLCDLVHPKYGILTKIGSAHLETFGSEEAIQKTKFELIESLPLDGIGILNKDDPKQRSYQLKNTCKILWIGIEEKDVDVQASNLKCSNTGTTFEVTFKGDKKKYSFETKLLGEHNIYNILSALALGKEFGINISQLQQAVKSIRPIEHRLELKRLGNFYQIDDAYNSNPTGAKNALEVLSMMPGIKVIVTPGMIELGKKEKELNEKFGEQIAELSQADYVILIGEKQTLPIKEGLERKHFDMNKVIVYNNVIDAYTFIRGINKKEDIYALFENDLPDTYNEK